MSTQINQVFPSLTEFKHTKKPSNDRFIWIDRYAAIYLYCVYMGAWNAFVVFSIRTIAQIRVWCAFISGDYSERHCLGDYIYGLSHMELWRKVIIALLSAFLPGCLFAPHIYIYIYRIYVNSKKKCILERKHRFFN